MCLLLLVEQLGGGGVVRRRRLFPRMSDVNGTRRNEFSGAKTSFSSLRNFESIDCSDAVVSRVDRIHESRSFRHYQAVKIHTQSTHRDGGAMARKGAVGRHKLSGMIAVGVGQNGKAQPYCEKRETGNGKQQKTNGKRQSQC